MISPANCKIMPKISVIVPVYNTEKYIHRCVDSILAQTFIDFELLLVNDGSKDSSGKICDEYAAKDSRVRVFHKENGGVSSARNVGLDNVKGEWVAFCDSDDYVYPDWLKNYNIIEYGVKYDIICQGLDADKPISLGTKSCQYGIDFRGPVNNVIDKLSDALILGYLHIKAFRFSLIDKQKLRFDDNLKFKEDETFVLKYMQQCQNGVCINKIGYLYSVPDWNKYTLSFEDERYLYENLFAEIRKIDVGRKFKYFGNVREQLTDVYIQEFYRNPSRRKECLKGLRDILKIDYCGSQVFFITKLFIYMDPTTYFSKYVLLCHLKLKYGRF